MPALGARRVVDLRAADVERVHRRISLSALVRANRVASLLSRLLSLAQRWEWVERNVAVGIERNREHGRQRYLSPAELERLLRVLADWPDRRTARIVLLLLFTGSRRGEVCSARWGSTARSG